ncbi:class I SAM-dependent methyltransferase [Methanomassiliicoccus luminyensis]|uniref:class I SAM-dependent methyltransferase n=1 Tax=Methanomassiliicoccus luminyensis TaxID=1080712 RepID=UPI00036A6AC4|nr:class I SAM-dependent methyltransferase [Methanomassiliicoccus luminyensis]
MNEPGVGPLGRAKLVSDWLPSGKRYLDIGCSDGEVLHWVGERCELAVGLDVDRRTMTEARKKCQGSEFSLGSADRLPFAGSTFDTVSMLDVLEHVPDPIGSLKEVDRVLKPGGRLILSVPHRGAFGFVDAQRSRLFAAGRKVLLGKDDEVLDHKHYRFQEVMDLLPGYTVLRRHNGGLLVYPLCGYVLMFTDNMGGGRISGFIRSLEEKDFVKDYGPRSWHIMLDLRKGAPS